MVEVRLGPVVLGLVTLLRSDPVDPGEAQEAVARNRCQGWRGACRSGQSRSGPAG